MATAESVRNIGTDNDLSPEEKARALEIAQAAWGEVRTLTVLSPGDVAVSRVREEVYKYVAPVDVLERATSYVCGRLALIREHAANIKKGYRVEENNGEINRLYTAPLHPFNDSTP